MFLLTFDISVNSSIKVNFACFMAMFFRKFALWNRFGFTSLKRVLDFPTYWILHYMHSIKWITYWLLQVNLWNALNIHFVCWPINVFVFNTSVQHSAGLIGLQGIELLFSLTRLFLKFLPCLTVWPPLISWRFLLHLNAINSVAWNAPWNLVFIRKIL